MVFYVYYLRRSRVYKWVKVYLGTLVIARGTLLLGWNRSARRVAVYVRRH